jgi:flagellar protein FlaF
MSYAAAKAYARTAQESSSPREIEAQTLLMAARKLVEVQTNWNGPDKKLHAALLFNRRLWTIFMSAAESNDNPQPLEIRQNILNIAVFVMHRTMELQTNPNPEKLQSLIDINSNIAAGLSGRA